jgi:scyllo-inositol 2-dehydrogenase (NADP+)
MKVVVIGLGVQGHKRAAIAGDELVATVDPLNTDADYRDIRAVPLSDYDAALACIPDEPKADILNYLLENGKHVLVEKPLWAADDQAILKLQQTAQSHQVVCYTAYNHRFEPHYVKMRETLDAGILGQCYHCRLFYGNGTARLVRNSNWRDQGAGVLTDLTPHLLDLMDFWFGHRSDNYQCITTNCFENQSPDHVILANHNTQPQLEFEMTLLSWRNDFSCDIFAEKGSAHIRSLCKWGPSQFILRRRVLPSGRPPEEITTLTQADPTWQLEYDHFKQLIQQKIPTDLSKDVWINQQIRQLSQESHQPCPT